MAESREYYRGLTGREQAEYEKSLSTGRAVDDMTGLRMSVKNTVGASSAALRGGNKHFIEWEGNELWGRRGDSRVA